MNLLVPVDSSPWSRRACETAKFFAADLHGEYQVLYLGPEQPEHTLRETLNLDATTPLTQDTQGEVLTALQKQLQVNQELPLLVMALEAFGDASNYQTLRPEEQLKVLMAYPGGVILTRRGMRIPEHLQHILIPLDASPHSACVVPLIQQMGESTPIYIDLLHVAGQTAPHELGALPTPRFLDHPSHEWQAWEQEFIKRFFSTTPKWPVRLHVARGGVIEAILNYAEKLKPDLVAMGWGERLEEVHSETLRQVLLRSPSPLLVFHETCGT
jgi:nucleotide-binding universal stress UspA family protein